MQMQLHSSIQFPTGLDRPKKVFVVSVQSKLELEEGEWTESPLPETGTLMLAAATAAARDRSRAVAAAA